MIDVRCPVCGLSIPLEDVNVSTDIALCRRCGKDYAFSELRDSMVGDVDLHEPPEGTWYKDDFDSKAVGASTRSLLGAGFLVPFTLVWAGGSVGTIYGSQIIRGQFDLGLSLFGLLFLIGSILLISMCAMMLAGKVEVTLRGDDGVVFTGVGSIGRYKRFVIADVERIVDGNQRYRYGGQQSRGITLRGKRQLTFGTLLDEEKRHFMMKALRSLFFDPTRRV